MNLREKTASLVELDKITCDTRDPKHIAQDIFNMGVATLSAALPCADYGGISRQGKLWLLERKEAKDFLNCLSDREGEDRLYSQVERMVAQDPADFIFWLPEGLMLPGQDGKVRVGRGKSAWDYKAVIHAYMELAELGVVVLPPVADGYAASAIVQVHESMNLGVPKYIVEHNRRPLKLRNGLSIPAKFLSPLIGTITTQNLGYVYNNAWSLMQAVMEDPEGVQKVPKVGPSTVDKLRKLLTGRINDEAK
jgi:hypothetical protein